MDEYDIEDGLLKLCEYGKPWLYSCGNNIWHCKVDMFVIGKGIDFSIASDYDHLSMQLAVRCCLERLQKTLNALTE